jgi:hypothetical protein
MEQAVHNLGTIAALSTGETAARRKADYAGDWSTTYAQHNLLCRRVLSRSLNKSTGPTVDPDHLF